MKLNKIIKVLSVAALIAFVTSTATAQENGDRQRRNRDGQSGEQGGPGGNRGGRGNFDPAQMREFIMERAKEYLEVTDEAEWKVLEPMIWKVTEARMAAFTGGRGFGRGGRGGPSGDNNRGGFGGQSNTAAEALQKAIDAKASNAETKAALDKFVADRKAKQAELEKAQAALRKVLTPRQEAIATLNGLL
jgi:hypothetical protein